MKGELPDFASKLNYIAFPQAESISGLNIDYAFSLLFPDLPSADDMANDYGQKKFKAAVIAAIDRNEQSGTVTLASQSIIYKIQVYLWKMATTMMRISIANLPILQKNMIALISTVVIGTMSLPNLAD